MASVLVVDDEVLLAEQVAQFLGDCGHVVRSAATGAEALEAFAEGAPDLVLLDLRLPDADGLDLLEAFHEADPGVSVVLMTAYGTVPDAVRAMRLGAADYVQKPLDLDELQLLVDRLVVQDRRERELDYHRARGREFASGIVGDHPEVLRIFDQIDRLAEAGLPPGRRPSILITGETGTGKGLIARALHERLGGGPFIEVNCTALPESLMEAELFGHERGSFTDAKSSRTGLFEAATGGTIFLDEIGHAGLELQAKLLKAIEDKRIRRLGASRDTEVDVHVIAATHADLDEAVTQRQFREDLLHRLRVLSFHVPSLRERPDDIDALALHFCEHIGAAYKRQIKLGSAALRELRRYPWPGNVRELRNVIERAILLERGEELEPHAFTSLRQPAAASDESDLFQLPEGGVQLAELEKDLIRQAIQRTGGNRTRAAALLGLTRDSLRYRLEKFGLD